MPGADSTWCAWHRPRLGPERLKAPKQSKWGLSSPAHDLTRWPRLSQLKQGHGDVPIASDPSHSGQKSCKTLSSENFYSRLLESGLTTKTTRNDDNTTELLQPRNITTLPQNAGNQLFKATQRASQEASLADAVENAAASGSVTRLCVLWRHRLRVLLLRQRLLPDRQRHRLLRRRQRCLLPSCRSLPGLHVLLNGSIMMSSF